MVRQSLELFLKAERNSKGQSTMDDDDKRAKKRLQKLLSSAEIGDKSIAKNVSKHNIELMTSVLGLAKSKRVRGGESVVDIQMQLLACEFCSVNS